MKKINQLQITDVITKHLDKCLNSLENGNKFEDYEELKEWKEELYTNISIVKKIIELYYC